MKFTWTLPLLATKELNEATDAAVEAVQEQIVASLRAAADNLEKDGADAQKPAS